MKHIPNPNKISQDEQEFLKRETSISNEEIPNNLKSKHKIRTISMPDHFYQRLDKYLKYNPTEGNKSSFMVRVVSNYLKEQGF
ncbi:hypothetical protein [Cardinium endosymbiont of Bemisia tabaci]|uniref:hypothetical protein n=1 Tax=Cardinium endosymbiont of Bemisia tabaci TaxID=672794 RepID=UPI000442CF87|nr:hypothetical protein [Cardinium endosymbiont of Bemisia tabaci]CDG50397.1 Hypothetical protein CHV_p032 [Cardinium endosymbiont cBtQ1 of Bemisia tabaci]